MGVTWLEMTSLLNMNIISILCSKSSWNIHVMVELGKQFKEARNVLFLIHFFFSKVLSASLVTQITISITLGINMFYSTKINQFGSAKCLMHFHAPFTNLVCMTFSSPTVWQTPPPPSLSICYWSTRKQKYIFKFLLLPNGLQSWCIWRTLRIRSRKEASRLPLTTRRLGNFLSWNHFQFFSKAL